MKSSMTNFFIFPIKHLPKYLFSYILYFFIKLLHLLLVVFQPFVWAYVLQDIYSPDKSEVINHIYLFVAVEFAQVLTYFVGELLQNKLNFGMITDIKAMMIRAVIDFKMSVIQKAKVGEFVSKFHSDVVTVVEFWNNHFPNFAIETLKMMAMSIIIALVDFYLFLLIAFILLVFAVVFAKYGKKLQNRYYEFRKTADVYFSNMHETMNNLREIKNLGIKKKAVAHSCEIFEEIRQGEISYGNLGASSQFVTGAINTILLLTVLLYSAKLVVNGDMTAVKFVVFFSYISRFSASVKDISRINTKLQQGRVCFERIEGILFDADNFEECLHADLEISDVNKIEFRNVNFSYDKMPTLRNLSFSIEDHSMLAIVGASGNGKSTLLNLLNRLYADYQGEIMLNDIEIRKISEESYRKCVSRVFQEPLLFNRSIKENLTIAGDNISMDKMVEICKSVGIHPFIESLPQGYDTIVHENSNNLSVGQKQRIAIARSLLTNAKVLLFDEITSALDNETQEIVLKMIEKNRHHHILVVVSHKIANIVTADKIVVLDKGEIAGIGKHNELLQNCRIYKMLY
ncbi:MAG: ABC transporter ATP-binding protein, partial [Peptostreptococcaceae bacterium]|nr:ABC transporter ATP-binding protein [Peptostreptococcaceae bacterium]